MRGLLRLLQSDFQAKADWCYQSRGPRAIVKALCTDGSAAMILYRLMQASRRRRLWPLEMIFNKLNAVLCQCVIGRGADFGPGLVLIHSNGVVINGQVRGGRNVLIEHQVTIGAEKRQSPTLGDDIFIGAGAKIIGDVSLGSYCRIGAGAVVFSDVPEGASAVGNPARVIDRYADLRIAA